MQISIQSVMLGMVQTNCYLIYNDATKEAVIVDPADNPEAIKRRIGQLGLKPLAILLTHGHFDHIMGADGVRSQYHIPVYVHELDEAVMEDPELNGCPMIGRNVSVKADKFVKDKDCLTFGGMLFQVLFTPGHTQGGVCYYMPQIKKLLCGDTLFEGSVGRTDLPTGSMRTLIQSIREKLFTLDDDVEALPGHGGSTTIGYEKKYNPFL